MQISTHTIFYDLIKKLQCDFLCDIGALDCKDSIFFKKSFPSMHVAAFEANPNNYNKIIKREDIPTEKFDIYPFAISNKNEQKKFYSYMDSAAKRNGISSLNKLIETEVVDQFTVESKRLDEFVMLHYSIYKFIALWIDVEGAAYDVIDGLTNIKDKVTVLHVELNNATIYHNQKDKTDVIECLNKLGFKEVAQMPHALNLATDAVFVRKDLLQRKEIKNTILFSKIRSNLTGRMYKKFGFLKSARQKMIKY